MVNPNLDCRQTSIEILNPPEADKIRNNIEIQMSKIQNTKRDCFGQQKRPRNDIITTYEIRETNYD